MNDSSIPILYSFRRCPYAMRARMAIAAADIDIEHRELLLKNKPQAMLQASPKGTVPVLVLPDGNVLDESLDIMQWAMKQRIQPAQQASAQSHQRDLLTLSDTAEPLIEANDSRFKTALDRYKYPQRFPDCSPMQEREQAAEFLFELEQNLQKQNAQPSAYWLAYSYPSYVDLAIFPFVRQFAGVDTAWFREQPWPGLICWLDNCLNLPVFDAVMKKYPPWQPTDLPRQLRYWPVSGGSDEER